MLNRNAIYASADCADSMPPRHHPALTPSQLRPLDGASSHEVKHDTVINKYMLAERGLAVHSAQAECGCVRVSAGMPEKCRIGVPDTEQSAS